MPREIKTMIQAASTAWGGIFRLTRAALAPLLLAAAGAASAQPSTPAVIEVQPGDTFSGIAARHTGDARTWRSLYRADLSNLPNPNRIAVGMRLELTTD